MNLDFEVELVLNELSKCGLYEGQLKGDRRIVESNAQPKCLDIEELLLEMEKWAITSGTDLCNACPDTVAEGKKTYLYEVTKHKNTYLAGFWVAVPRSKTGVSSMPGNKPTSSTKPKSSKSRLDPKDIPGYMAYYLFMPKKKRFASIQLWFKGYTKPAAALPKLKEYLIGYINGHSTYRCEKGGFSEFPKNHKSYMLNSNLVSRVDWARCVGDTDLAIVKKNASKVYRLTYKIKNPDLITSGANEMLWDVKESVNKFKHDNHNHDDRKQLKLVVPVAGMTLKDIEELEDNYEDFSEDEAFNVGFRISRDSKEYWLSGSYKKASDSLNLTKLSSDSEFPDQNNLHSQILDKFDTFLES